MFAATSCSELCKDSKPTLAGKSRANARYQPKQSAEKGPHSITSSARARSVGGIVRFRSRAAFRFITSSKERRLFDREVCGRGPLQDLVYKYRRLPTERRNVWPVRDQ